MYHIESCNCVSLKNNEIGSASGLLHCIHSALGTVSCNLKIIFSMQCKVAIGSYQRYLSLLPHPVIHTKCPNLESTKIFEKISRNLPTPNFMSNKVSEIATAVDTVFFEKDRPFHIVTNLRLFARFSLLLYVGNNKKQRNKLLYYKKASKN